MNHTIFCTHTHNSFTPVYFESIVSKYFNFQPYTPDANTSGASIILNLPYQDTIRSLSKSSLDQCKFIIIDNLQECFYCGLEELQPWADKVILLTGGKHKSHLWDKVINTQDWFWYYESLWYKMLEYDKYIPAPSSQQKLFLMPMRRIKPGRDMIYSKLKDLLNDAIWSYVDRGKELPNYLDSNKEDQRFFNPAWYNDTMFSIVNEDSNDNEPLIWTEKTCKPIAFYHPFILVAQQGVLEMIKQAGFETFPELFDESYDSMSSLKDRVNCVTRQVHQFDPAELLNPIVQEKLKFNHDRFFNVELVKQNLINQVLDPLSGYLND